MEKKAIIILFFLLIYNVSAIEILYKEDWQQGSRQSLIINYNDLDFNLSNTEATLLVIGGEDDLIILNEKFYLEETTETTEHSVIIPTNEENTLYRLELRLDNGEDKVKEIKIINIEPLPFWKKLFYYVKSHFGFKPF